MSDIPTRKKSPEEIAALREKELAARVPATPQVTPQPQAAPPSALAPPQQNQPAVLPAYPKKSLRKRPELHGTPHVFDGLRPQEAQGQSSPSQPASAPAAALPSQKRSDQEIMRMRQRDLMQTRPPVAHIQSMALHPFLVAMLYAATLATPILTSRYWHLASPARWYAPGVGGGVLLVLSVVIYFSKPRGRHHAAIVCGVVLVNLCFCILITLKSPHAQ
jgi:hypothetical protein